MVEEQKINKSSYTIHMEEGGFHELNNYLEQNQNSKLFLLVDENTEKHCLPTLMDQVSHLQRVEIIEIESGEESKSIDICKGIWAAMEDYGADRQSIVINLGGGVICDLGGFVASVYKRGIKFINIPTTLLSQVDAAIGGKTGVNLDHLKNIIGSFWMPEAVFVHTPFLMSLSERQFNSGIAEILKHALIRDRDYWLSLDDSLVRDDDQLKKIIQKSIEIKNGIISDDYRESASRKLLNFGHTIGHAVETLYLDSNKPLLHGEAIAVGIICESWISMQNGYIQQKDLSEITGKTLHFFRKYLDIINTEKKEEIYQIMAHDKKNQEGTINLTLLDSIGSGLIDQTADKETILASLDYFNSHFK